MRPIIMILLTSNSEVTSSLVKLTDRKKARRVRMETTLVLSIASTAVGVYFYQFVLVTVTPSVYYW